MSKNTKGVDKPKDVEEVTPEVDMVRVNHYRKLSLDTLLALHDMVQTHCARAGHLIDAFSTCGGEAEFVAKWITSLSSASRVSTELANIESAILYKFKSLSGYDLNGDIIINASKALEEYMIERSEKDALGKSKVVGINKPGIIT